jgi:cobalt-zinc-cadmium efflux system membrane fusion protein
LSPFVAAPIVAVIGFFVALSPVVAPADVPGSASPSSQPPKPSAMLLDAAWAPYVQLQTLALKREQVVHNATGRIAYDEDHTQRITSPLSGRVVAVHVKLGDTVKAGDALLTLASPEATQLWGEAQRAKLAFGAAQKHMKRVRALKEDGAIAERDVLTAEAELTLAASAAQSAQAHLQALGLSLTGTGQQAVLRAHGSGRITARQVAPGQEVRSDGPEPLLVISALDHVWLLADIFEQDLAYVAEGAPLQLRVPAYPKQVFDATVDHISDTVDPQSRTIKVRAVIHNPDHRLKPDMFAAVSLSQAAADLLFVPSAALLSGRDGAQVLVVDPQNVVSVRPVTVGPLAAGQYRILGGLSEGERIITKGAPFVLAQLRD